MRHHSWLRAVLALPLVIGMASSAMAQTGVSISPTPHSNEVNLIGGLTGGYLLTSDSPTASIEANPNNGTGYSIMDVLYGKGNYTLLNGTNAGAALYQQFTNPDGIAMMATVKYAAATETFGYFAAGASGTASSAFQGIVSVSGDGFASAGALTITAGTGNVTQLGPNSFLLTPSQSGSPFSFAEHAFLSPQSYYYSSDQNQPGITTGSLTDQGTNGFNHMAIFAISGQPGTYALAWEDAPKGSTDYDYNDIVVQIKFVPEPSTMALAGLGALGLIGYAVRRRKAVNA